MTHSAFDREIVERPLELLGLRDEGVLNDLRPQASGEFDGLVGREGIDDESLSTK